MSQSVHEFLAMEDDALQAQCDVHIYKASGPGGQHRNKVSSAVRLRHRPTGVEAHGDDSRSQHENRRLALRRLRMNMACRVRAPVPKTLGVVPPVIEECLFTPKGRTTTGRRLKVGRRDRRFWPVAAWVLDMLEEHNGAVSDAAKSLGISTGNIVSLLKSERHLLTAAQEIRKAHGLKPLI
jgi:RF-1 domain